MSDQSDERHLTYEEAARETGHSTEALRKMLARGKLRRGRDTNSGRPTIALAFVEIEALKAGRPFRSPPRTESRPDRNPDRESDTIRVLSAAAEVVREVLEQRVQSIEAQLGRAEKLADEAGREAAQARIALDNERRARDQERTAWTASLDSVTKELAASRQSRTSDRQIALAAVRRMRQQSVDLKEQLDQVLAGQRQGAAAGAPVETVRRLGLLGRLANVFRTKGS